MKYPLERRAEILIEALQSGDYKAAAERNAVSEKSLYNWRKELETNPDFTAIYEAKKSKAEERWLDEVPASMAAQVAFLTKAAQVGDPRDPDMVHSIAGALKILAAVSQESQLIDLKIAELKAARAAKKPATVQALRPTG